MKNLKYQALCGYLIENEMNDIAIDVANDEKNDRVILMIRDHFDDEYMLKESSTELLKDMFTYYVKHK